MTDMATELRQVERELAEHVARTNKMLCRAWAALADVRPGDTVMPTKAPFIGRPMVVVVVSHTPRGVRVFAKPLDGAGAKNRNLGYDWKKYA